MRLFSLIVTLFYCAHVASAQNGPERSAVQESIVWNAPFESFAPSMKNDALVLLVVTNDPPWPKDRPAKGNPAKRVEANWDMPGFWCQEVLTDSILRLLSDRDDLQARLSYQSIAAGLPLELTGGEPFDMPSQAVVAICDDQYRLLSFVVGVPNADELATMVEDAEETSVLVQQARDDPQTVMDRLADRSRSRVGRRFQIALEESVLSARSDGDDENFADPQTLRHQIRIVSQDIDPVYLLDVKLRFGLSDRSDRVRLRILEQHVETRRPWCELMLPFVAGISLTDIWQPLVESLWGHPPIVEDEIDSELLNWVQSQTEFDSVVLHLKAPMRFEHLQWPPPKDPVAKRSITWSDVHARALEHSFRSITIADAARLIRALDLVPINVYEPTLVRYLFLQKKKREPFVVRQGDPPSRFSGMLKRSKSTLVTK